MQNVYFTADNRGVLMGCQEIWQSHEHLNINVLVYKIFIFSKNTGSLNE